MARGRGRAVRGGGGRGRGRGRGGGTGRSGHGRDRTRDRRRISHQGGSRGTDNAGGRARRTPRPQLRSEQVPRKETANSLAERGIKGGADVILMFRLSSDQPRERVGTATVFGDEDGKFLYNCHNHDLRTVGQNNLRQICQVWKCNMDESKGHLPYEYDMPSNPEQPVPQHLSEMQRIFRYAWDVRMMDAVREEQSPEPPRQTLTPKKRMSRDLGDSGRQVRRRLDVGDASGSAQQEPTGQTQPPSPQPEPPGITQWLTPGFRPGELPEDTDDQIAVDYDVTPPRTPLGERKKVPSPPPLPPLPPDDEEIQPETGKGDDIIQISETPPREPSRSQPTSATKGSKVSGMKGSATEPKEPSASLQSSPQGTRQGQHEDSDVEEIQSRDTTEALDMPDFMKRISEFKISKYNSISVYVDIHNVEFSEYTVRDISEDHVNELADSMRNDGVVSSTGKVTVTILEKDVLQDLNSHIQTVNGQRRLQVKCRGLDGRHRKVCFHRLEEEKKNSDPTMAPYFRWVQAELYYNPSLTPMTELEQISMGSHMNESSARVRKSTFSDNVHSTISCLKVICKKTDKSPENVDRHILVVAMKAMKSLPSVSDNQYAKYAEIAIAFSRNGMPTTVLGDYPKVGLVHTANEELLLCDKIGLILCLECVQAYLSTPAPKGQKKGNFDDVGSRFYTAARELYAKARVLSSRHGISIVDLLDLEVPITSTNPDNRKRVREIIRNNLANFLYRPTKMQDRQNQRLKMLERSVGNHFGATESSRTTASAPPPDEVPPVRPSAEESVGRTPRSDPQPPSQGPRRSLRRRETTRRVPSPSPTPTKGRRKAPEGSRAKTRKAKKPEVESPSDYSKGSDDEVVPRKGESSKKGVSLFDDEHPALLPVGCNDIPEYTGIPRPKWVYASALPCVFWPKKFREFNIEHVTPWLDYMHIPKQHRANVFCSSDELKTMSMLVNIHAVCEWHLHIESYETGCMGEICQTEMPDGTPISKESYLDTMVLENHESSIPYFSMMRERLNQQGYCLLRGFASDERECFDTIINLDVMAKLAEHYADSFPGEEAMSDPKNRVEWNLIVNRQPTEDEADRRKGIGRGMTTLEGVTASVEQDQKSVWVAKSRALLDVRIANVVTFLGLGNRKGTEEMAIPKTGGRFLYTTPHCGRQNLHTDFECSEDRGDDDNPGYFVVTSGPSTTYIWVLPYSHQYATMSPQDCARISKIFFVKKVEIPPFSMFIGRGDLIHAGPGYRDYDVPPTDGGIRYHSYFVPIDKSLVDGVHYFSDLNPAYRPEDVEQPLSPSPPTTQRGEASAVPSAGSSRGSVKRPIVIGKEDDENDDGKSSSDDEESPSDGEEKAGSSQNSDLFHDDSTGEE